MQHWNHLRKGSLSLQPVWTGGVIAATNNTFIVQMGTLVLCQDKLEKNVNLSFNFVGHLQTVTAGFYLLSVGVPAVKVTLAAGLPKCW